MSGRKSRNKGARIEREFVNLLKEHGLDAERIPLSGACGGSFSGDIKIAADRDYLAEVKARKNGQGFKVIENWLADNDMLFLKRDRQDPLVVLPFDLFLHLLNAVRTP